MAPTIFPRRGYRWIILGIVLLLVTNTAALWAADEANRVLALIDYIGGDYRNAVKGGKVVNADEYQEMTELSAGSLELFKQQKVSKSGDRRTSETDRNAIDGPKQKKRA